MDAANAFKTPILLVTYKREASLREQLGILRRLRPQRLYVFADGPKHSGEATACLRARAVLDNVDWDCEVFRKFEKTNLGCGKGPASAISWFFEREVEGIILEDDLLPHPDFFRFAVELLERFRHHERVMDICGTNRLGTWTDGGSSYLFSRWGSSCGMATWRRAWNQYDFEIKAWDDPNTRRRVRELFHHPLWRSYLNRIFSKTRRGGEAVTWWDYQWRLVKCLHDGLSATPAKNLVRNVGFDAHSTHDREPEHSPRSSKCPVGMDFPLRHPETIAVNERFEAALLGRAVSMRNYLSSLLPHRLKQRIRPLLRGAE